MEGAAEAARNAAQQLQQTAELIEQRALGLDHEARQQQFFQLATTLQSLVELQRPIASQLEEYQPHYNPEPVLPTPDELVQLTAAQEVVRLRVHEVRRETAELPTFDWTLEQAERDMARAVAAAQRNRIQPEAWEAARLALSKLNLAAEALSEHADSQPAETTPSDAASDGAGQNDSPRLVPPLASLRLLRALQQDINAQTAEQDQNSDKLSRIKRLSELSSQQRALGMQLALLLEQLTTPAQE